MNASLLANPVSEQLHVLTALVWQLRDEVGQLRSENAQLRQQVSELKCDVGYWKSRHADAVARNVKLQAELDLAYAEIRLLKAERFGKQSEKQSTSDRSNELVDPSQPLPTKNKRGQQPARPAPKRRDYSHLPAREQIVDVGESEKCCDGCGQPLADLGFKDDGEQLEIETVVYRKVVRRRRLRRTCECHDQPQTITATSPPKLLPKSRLGTSVWVQLLIEKFHLQRPTHRTLQQFRLLGLSIAPGTVADGLKRIEPMLTPIYEAIRQHHLQSKYYQADETRWRVFVDKAGKVGHNWWLWLFAGEDSVVFVLDPSRSHDVPQSHFGRQINGVLMVDRYSGYKAMQHVKQGDLVLAFCWAHVRRDFVRVGKGYPELTQWALGWLGRIRQLYHLNRQRLSHASGSEEFAAADILLRAHVKSIAEQREIELGNDKLREPCRKALVSLSEHWSGLALFIDDTRVPLDNNYGERLIRNPAVGRKNYYGSGSQWSGRLAMMLFSIFATLAMWKINPLSWLTWYFEACAANSGLAPVETASFLPWNLSETRLAELRISSPSGPKANTS
jgi:transposase